MQTPVLRLLCRGWRTWPPTRQVRSPVVRAAIRSYRASESAARDLISTVWNVLDRNLDGTASVVNALVDLADEEDKKRDLLTAWNGFKVEQRNQFPELVPTATGSEWAGVTSGRVLNAKHSTATRSSSTQSSRQVLDRVARAAASSSGSGPVASTSSPRVGAPAANAFPPLQGSGVPTSSSSTTPFRQAQRVTPWASSGAPAAPSPPVVRAPTSVPGPGARAKGGPAVLSKSAFPELPTSNSTRLPKAAVGGNQSLRNILGPSAPVQPAWGGDSGGSGSNTPASGEQADGDGSGTGAGGGGGSGKKKGKGKQKQTLFTLGTFPA
uniref:Polyketide synthetase protein n=1 Tax=Ganoderma boninense TaxID=34458 RepID=A0A5K1K3Z0_9APHY|nr:Polyketide synthetase protein [Ganoderma boninense]